MIGVYCQTVCSAVSRRSPWDNALEAARSVISHDARNDGTTDEFISRVSHDLRTPLAAIKAAIGVIIANEPPGTSETIGRMFKNIDRAADQMNSMIANLADLTRLRAGEAALRRDWADLNDLTRRVVKTAEPAAHRQAQTIEAKMPQHRLTAIVDAARIERALLNLIENAQRFSPAGGTIHVQLEKRKRDVLFSVTDEGPGLPDAAAEMIFSGRPPDFSGAGKTGLGLPVVRAVAEAHHGDAWTEPAPGGGARFCLAIPSTMNARNKDGNG